MRQNWTDPFSVERVIRRVGVSMLVGIIGCGGAIGVPVLKYQSLQSQLQTPLPPSPRWPDQTARLVEKIGASGVVVASQNGWVISGKDPDAWIRQMASAPPEFPLRELCLELVQDHYVLRLSVEGGKKDAMAD